MSLAYALRRAGEAAGRPGPEIDAHIEAFYAALRAADPDQQKAMIDDPSAWTPDEPPAGPPPRRRARRKDTR